MRTESMRTVRGVKAIVEYLASVNCPMGKSTVDKLIRTKEIPHMRFSERVIVFNLDTIDEWLKGVDSQTESSQKRLG
ncbi:helix-turn-helix transcriptional regulator [Lysinibacillus sp. BSL11]